ncbi:MAG: FtsX-like permease family protein, partial [Actinomycetota bacterium]|nr:FtsX-like permease family protein [Actinomycetota bacterium]
MNFSKLAIKNIKQNFSNYFIYFISLTFSVMIFYIFCTLFFNEQFFKISQASISLRGTFKGTAIIVALFSFIFIWYSNSFFIASRKKEIATYCLLGMEKRQIGRLLFYENMILGTAALLLGIFIGTLFSKLFAMMLVYFMKFTSEIKFSINQISVYITLVLFFILFLINSIHSYRIIHRFKLIELFRAQKEGEKIPKTSYSITILSILVIVACYILSLTLPLQLAILFSLLIICMVVLGTYGLFHNLVALYIKKIIKNKKVYYNRMNLVSFS